MARKLIKGTEIELGGEIRIVPALNFRQIQELAPELAAINKTQGEEQSSAPPLAIGLKVITAAMSRNYPDVTEDEVSDWVDLGNVHQLMAAIMGNSGFLPVSSGNAPAAAGAGEAPKK